MPFVPVPNTIEVRLLWTLGNAEVMNNVLHYIKDEDVDVTGDMAEEIGQAIYDAFVDVGSLQAVLHTSAVLQKVQVKDISAVDLPIFDFFIEEAGLEGTTAILPYHLALCTTLRTQFGGRGNRGRVFFGGFSELSNVADGLADTSARTACQNFVTAIQGITIASADPDTAVILGVTSRSAHVGGDPEAAPIPPVTHGVVSWVTNRRWDTQRRRSNKIRV